MQLFAFFVQLLPKFVKRSSRDAIVIRYFILKTFLFLLLFFGNKLFKSENVAHFALHTDMMAFFFSTQK